RRAGEDVPLLRPGGRRRVDGPRHDRAPRRLLPAAREPGAEMILLLALLLAGHAASPAAAATAAAASVSWTVAADTSAATGSETRIVYRPAVSPLGAKLEPDTLASATTSFAVVKAEAQKDGSWIWTVLPLDEGKLSFVSRWKLDGQAAAAPPVELAARAPAVPK